MTSRNTLNFILGFVSFLNLSGMVFTGFIMKYTLPPGTGGLGRNFHGGTGHGIQHKELFSMTRHEWGNIHFYLAIIFIALMIIHIIMHWTWIKCYLKSVFGLK